MKLPTSIRAVRHIAIGASLAFFGLIPEHAALAQNRCASQASLVNPLAATSSGVGGSGAPEKQLARLAEPLSQPGKSTGEIGAIGGTGMIAGKPGIGGTGVSEGGIGGTGIVGLITGFASVCVNGVEVFFDENTPVLDNGQPGSAAQLAVGQVVVVQSPGAGTELSALRITVIHAVVGPVEFIDAEHQEMRVLGQTVKRLDHDESTDLQAGNWVAVSGFRLAQGEIAASRIERIPEQAQVQLLGAVSRFDREAIIVDGTRVLFDRQQGSADLAAGQEVLVVGDWDGKDVRAQRIQANPTSRGLGRVNQVVLEGYIHSLKGNQLNLGHGTLTLNPDVRIVGGSTSQLSVNKLVQVSGWLADDQSVRVQRIEFSRSSPGSRVKNSDDERRPGSIDDNKSSKVDDSPSGSVSPGGSRSSSDSERSGDSGSSGKTGDSGISGSSGKTVSSESSRSSGTTGNSDHSESSKESASSGSSGKSVSSVSSGGRSGGD